MSMPEHDVEAPVGGVGGGLPATPPPETPGAPGASARVYTGQVTVPTRVIIRAGGGQVNAVPVNPGPLTIDLDPAPGPPVPPLPPVEPALVGLLLSANVVTVGSAIVVTVVRSSASARELVVNLAVTPHLAGLGSLTIQPGQTMAHTEFRGVAPGTGTISATAGGVLIAKAITVTALPVPPDPIPPVPVPRGTLGYISPVGNGDGSQANPWGLLQVLKGDFQNRFAGGGTLWLMGGTYKFPLAQQDSEGIGYQCNLRGQATSPIIFRAMPGARVTIDGGFTFWNSANVWLWGCELIVSEPKPTGTSGSNPSVTGSPRGGVHFYSGGAGNKVINCLMHDNRQGASVWTPAVDAEVYGCLIYDNGWQGSDRAHGHGIYFQNPGPYKKFLTDNILMHRATLGFGEGRFHMHGYGESAVITNGIAIGNFAIGQRWLMADGAGPVNSLGHMMDANVLVRCPAEVASAGIQMAHLTENLFVDSTLQWVGGGVPGVEVNDIRVPPQARPQGATQRLRINRYEPKRAHLMLVDWQKMGSMLTDLSGFAQVGETVGFYNPTRTWEAPVLTSVYQGGPVSVPVNGGAEAFVLVKS